MTTTNFDDRDREIREAVSRGELQKDVASRFGITTGRVNQICRPLREDYQAVRDLMIEAIETGMVDTTFTEEEMVKAVQTLQMAHELEETLRAYPDLYRDLSGGLWEMTEKGKEEAERLLLEQRNEG